MFELALSILLAPTSVGGVSALPANESAILGVWSGRLNSLPGITLTLEHENGELSGAILFYLIRRDDAGHSTASPGVPEPLINPQFDGRTLTFLVSHRYAHPHSMLGDPPKTFRLQLTGTNKARLITEEGRAVDLVRKVGPPGAFP
jgi:hypothetical protein